MKTFSEYFQNLIGLSAVPPNCAVADLSTAQITDSDSGLRMTDTDTLNLRLSDAQNDCGPNSIWPLLAKAKKNALEDMYTDLLAQISSLNKERLPAFKGNVGQEAYKGSVNTMEGQLVTTSFVPKDLPGAAMKITAAGLILDTDADVALRIPGLASPLMVVCSANTPSYAPLAAPLYISLEGKPLTFSYIASGFKPRNNKLNCNCSAMQTRLNEYIPKLVDIPANGLLLQCELTCNPLHLIIANSEQVPAIFRVLATALVNKALEKTVELIQNSGEVDRYTMMETSYLWGKRNAYRKEYQDRINWLCGADGFRLELSSCYRAKSTSQMIIGNIQITGAQKRCFDCE
jgi:hypothetical protein